MSIYWQVYKNLEREIIKLAEIIHFDDTQEKVYSVHIADLLVRVSIEIEAVSKALYKDNGGNMNPVDDHGASRKLFFDTDCIQYLDKKWHITKKVVNVVASSFYFKKDENIVLRPLKDCNKMGEGRWKKAYQAVKHDRIGSLKAGNIGNLIKAMGALFILNLYNNSDKVEELGAGGAFDLRRGSALFSVNSFKATTITLDEHMDESNIGNYNKETREMMKDESVFIDRYTKETFVEMHKNYMNDKRITDSNVNQSGELLDYISRHPDANDKPLSVVCFECGEELERRRLGIDDDDTNISDNDKKSIEQAGMAMTRKIMSYHNMQTGTPGRRELVLNKLQQIYPAV